MQTKQYLNMNQQAMAEEGESDGIMRRRGFVMHPLSRGYRFWWYVTIAAAVFTGWLEPFKVAYLPNEGCW